MNDFWIDPFGLKLIQKSEEQTSMPKKKEENCVPAGSTIQVYNGFYPYYCNPMPMATQTIYYGNGYCYPQQPAAPIEMCKDCSTCKCKGCKKVEEKSKIFITKTSFWNPRQPQKSVFEK